jgi:hypothetical protein
VDRLKDEDHDCERERDRRGLNLPKDLEDRRRFLLVFERIEAQPGRQEREADAWPISSGEARPSQRVNGPPVTHAA